MSAVAGIAKAKGFEVSGSDSKDIYDPAKSVLDKYAIEYAIGYSVENLQKAFGGNLPDLVVATAAEGIVNTEVAAAEELGLKTVSYPELLGLLAADKKRIVVTGTHGKGTTAALIAWVLKNVQDDSFFIGGVLNNLQTNFYYGSGPNIVIEGDEYKSGAEDLTPKFNYYSPDVLLINNLELDHPDIYKDIEALKIVFKNLIANMPSDSTLIYNADDANVCDVAKDFKYKKIAFGFKSGEIKASEPVRSGNNFKIDISNLTANNLTAAKTLHLETIFPGHAYAANILAASAVLLHLGIDHNKIEENVRTYTGIKRRYEIITEGEYTIIDDYAHHPTAVRQTLEATRMKYPHSRIVCFFEPHTYSRTKETLKDLAHSFAAADLVYLAEVYPAREQKNAASITGLQVLAEVTQSHQNVFYVADKQSALAEYAKQSKPGDAIVVMAVGAFNTLVYDLKKALCK